MKAWSNNNYLKRFLVVQKLLKVVHSFSQSFSSDTHREKTSEWRKAI